MVCGRIVCKTSASGDAVFIQFAGSGSEIVVCNHFGPRWIASEANEEYCHIVEERMASSRKASTLSAENGGNEKEPDRKVQV